MATGFNTQVSNGEYRLQFETDNREYYLLMQETARRCVDGKPVTNADRIRAMSDEILAQEMIFFCPTDTVFKGTETYEKPHYTGLDGGYYSTSEELIVENLKWLQQPAKGE